MLDLNNYLKVGLTVDNVIFGFDESELKVLLIKRTEEPYEDQWALPGYFVAHNEDLMDAAKRVLAETTGIENVYLEQVGSFGNPIRHPSGRVVTVAYYSLINIKDFKLQASSIAEIAEWASLNRIKNLAFDHEDICLAAIKKLKNKIRTEPIGFGLLPPKFTLTNLQILYESILEIKLDKRNFRKKILKKNILTELEESQKDVAHRPAKLYSFNQENYEKLLASGYSLDIL